MGWSYAISSLIAIVAIHGKEGLSREQIFEINRRTYQANFEKYFDMISPDKKGLLTTSNFIEQRGKRFFLRKSYRLDKKALEYYLSDAKKKRGS